MVPYSEFIYHWQNLRNYTFYENRYEICTFYKNRYEIFVKNANFVPIFVKSVNFISIFVKSVNFINFVNGRWTHYKNHNWSKKFRTISHSPKNFNNILATHPETRNYIFPPPILHSMFCKLQKATQESQTTFQMNKFDNNWMRSYLKQAFESFCGASAPPKKPFESLEFFSNKKSPTFNFPASFIARLQVHPPLQNWLK